MKHTSAAVLPRETPLIEGYERLASLDLASIEADELARKIEAEAIAMFGLREARLTNGPAPSQIEATETGFVIPLSGLRLIGDGKLDDGWEEQARLFAAQVGSIAQFMSNAAPPRAQPRCGLPPKWMTRRRIFRWSWCPAGRNGCERASFRRRSWPGRCALAHARGGPGLRTSPRAVWVWALP